MSGKLYTYPNNFKSYKIEIAAKYSGYELNKAEFTAGVTNKSVEFLKKFPLGKVPAFEEGDFYLFETNAIAYYVGNERTRGGDKESEVLHWIGVADDDLLPAACTWVYPTLGIMQYNKNATEKAKETVKSIMKLLDDHLLTKTFLVGERITQADISMACTLLMLYVNVLEPSFRNGFVNTNRWFLTLINQPEFKSIIGDVELCSKAKQFDAKKFNEISGKNTKKEAQNKKKVDKPAVKEEKVSKKEPDAGDQPLQTKQAPVNPWANAPKPSMDMDAWKRCYSNSDATVSWKYFLENFKKEDYSIWSMEYKYNDELTLSFMACNLVSGMMQRLEKLRKHAFASVFVLGKSGNLKISGVWFWLGHELAFPLSPDWMIDYECFEWKKLDFDDEDTKKKVELYWSGEGDFGLDIIEQKIYK